MYSSNEESGNTVEGDDKPKNIPMEASGSGSTGVNIFTDVIDSSSPAKPIFWTFQGSHRYRCPYCDYRKNIFSHGCRTQRKIFRMQQMFIHNKKSNVST